MAYYKCGSVYTTQNSNVVVDTASGSVANFETDLALPLKSLEVDVNAVQSGTGDPSPDNVRPISGWDKVKIARCGKNFLFKPLIHYDLAPDNLNDMFFIRAGSYRFSFDDCTASDWRIGMRIKDANGNDLSDNAHRPNTGMSWRSAINCWIGGTNTTNKNISITIVEDCYIRMVFGFTPVSTVFTDIMLESGNTKTEYEPYNGIDVTINLGGTYFGGHFTQDKDGHRQFEVTHGFIASYNGETINEPWISSEDVYSQGATPTTGAQVVYSLATPIIIDLPDGEPITTLIGTNNIYADTGDTSLQFRKIE